MKAWRAFEYGVLDANPTSSSATLPADLGAAARCQAVCSPGVPEESVGARRIGLGS